MAEYRILIVEDDMTIAQTIAAHLASWNYEADYVKDFKNVLARVGEWNPHLIIMDISLPFYNGFYWCQEIRKISQVPVIFLSSADDNMNIIMAMDKGADDFISKPFELSVLTAKIGALLRRSYSMTGQSSLLEHRDLILNLSDGRVSHAGQQAELTRNELRILGLLMENAGKMVDRSTIMMRLWESDDYIDDNTLTVNVARIRRKLEEIGVHDYIVTQKGIGYMV